MLDRLFGLEKPHRISDGDEIDRLTTVYDPVTLGMVRGLLEDADIPYLTRDRGTGTVVKLVTGFSMFGTDIFVPTSAMETARDLIAGLEDAEAVTVIDGEDVPDGDADVTAEED